MARKRSRARGWALQVLYAWEVRGERDRLPDLLSEFISRRNIGAEAQEYLETLITTLDMYLEPVDAAITASLLNWRLERLSIIDRNILRLAGAEMLHLAIPPRVVIQEAIQLAEKYGTNESPRFINGVLDALMRRMEMDTSRTGGGS
ncbi:MAG TPA: transcription antitermination factor NusB [Longimicrobiales bacterium]|jgi:transcription antitermination protein NusB|nr:transcription antitermination factor NusB [Longimicrobiales bacterium]